MTEGTALRDAEYDAAVAAEAEEAARRDLERRLKASEMTPSDRACGELVQAMEANLWTVVRAAQQGQRHPDQ